METSCVLVFLFAFLFRLSHSANVTIHGASEWKYSTLRVRIGDSVLFKHKYHFGLYIFRNEKAFNSCDYTQAILLSKPNAIYRWNPSRPGFFFFSFKNSSRSSSHGCEKLAIMVVAASASPPAQSSEVTPPTAAPEPVSGGVVASSPAFPWPFQPRQAASAPTSMSPGASSPVPVPSIVSTDKGVGKGKGTPFIYSNPAVPLPTGEVDSETIQPFLPTSSHKPKMMMGLPAIALVLVSAVILIF